MVVPRITLAAVFGLFLVLTLFSPPPSFAQSVESQIEASNAQIERLKAEIAQLQKQLNTTSLEREGFQNAVKELDLSIQKLTKNITLTEAQIKQKDREIDAISGNISNTQGSIGTSQEQVAYSLRQLGALDNESAALMLLSGRSLSSFFDEAAALAAVRNSLQNHIHDLSNLKVDLEEDKTATEGKRKELAGLQRRLAQEKQGLAVARSEQNKLLTDTKSKEVAYQAQIAQKQAEQAAFERVLFELASGLSGSLGNIPAPGSRVLRWPLDNVFVTQEFGRTVDSVRLYASGSHDGIDLRATIGTPVRAALTGTVMEINQGAVQYCQYGKWVLLKHDNGLATLYAHLSKINVSRGQRVSTGEVLGFAGNTGYATGPHLHFTTYAANAVSYKQYMCKSGYTVTIPIAPVNAYLNPLSYLPR